MFNFKSNLAKFDSNLWQFHFPVPEEFVHKLIIENNKRVICTVNNSLRLRAAIMKSQDYFYILFNGENRKKLGLEEGDEIQICLEKDLSEYGFDMPEELSVLFEQDDEAYDYFMNLTIGKRRSLIYLVQKVKNTDSRLRKSLAIAHHLKEVRGKLDFKLLNETIKAFNRKSV